METVQAGTLDSSRSVLEEGREGLVEALRDWLASGEQVRVAAAVHVAARLRLTELVRISPVSSTRCGRDEIAVPAVYRSNVVLAARWRSR